MQSMPPELFLLWSAAPLVLVYAFGIIVALAKMGDCRKASSFALAGFVGLLLSALIRTAGTLMTLPAYRGAMTVQEITFLMLAVSYLTTFLTVVAMVLLIVAIFTGRQRPEGLKKG